MADMTDDDLLRIATTLGLPFGMLDHDYCKSMEIEPGTRSYGEVTCDGMVRFARAVLAAQPAPAPEELSPEFTDTARAALLWVLWHHQGASSAVGQPIRFALGMGAHDRLNGRQIAEAKQWATTTGSTTAEFHKVPAAPAVPVDMVLHCPACGLQHIDAPDPWVAKYGEELCKAKGFSLWTNPPHKSHLCRGCGHVWRPADVATAGVKAVSTKGKEDGPIKEPVARQTLPAPAVPAYTEGHCEEKAKKGGCQLHNLHCGYPACDRRPAAPAVPAVNCEWTNCPRRVGDVCCNERAAPAVQPPMDDPDCNYIAPMGKVCNKCGRIHRGITGDSK